LNSVGCLWGLNWGWSWNWSRSWGKWSSKRIFFSLTRIYLSIVLRLYCESLWLFCNWLWNITNRFYFNGLRLIYSYWFLNKTMVRFLNRINRACFNSTHRSSLKITIIIRLRSVEYFRRFQLNDLRRYKRKLGLLWYINNRFIMFWLIFYNILMLLNRVMIITQKIVRLRLDEYIHIICLINLLLVLLISYWSLLTIYIWILVKNLLDDLICIGFKFCKSFLWLDDWSYLKGWWFL